MVPELKDFHIHDKIFVEHNGRKIEVLLRLRRKLLQGPTPPKKEVLIDEINAILKHYQIKFKIYQTMTPYVN